VNYWKVILATAVIFGAGVMTGGLLVNQIQHSRPRNDNHPFGNGGQHPSGEWRGPRPRPPEILGDKFVQQLDEALKLTSEQRAAIQKIIADGQERNRSIWTNNSAQMREVIQDVRRRIRETLTPGQQKQFEDLMKQRSSKPTFTERLESIKYNLTPEEQMQQIDANRLRAMTNVPQFMPPPPPVAPTNAPAK
jgi:hypothetical protein